jgi:hypothetical protein
MAIATQEVNRTTTNRQELRRTTILLRPEDDENLKWISQTSGTPDAETIRRSLRLMRELMSWEREEGGQIILQKGKTKERIRFL